jgi:hypothetical protein
MYPPTLTEVLKSPPDRFFLAWPMAMAYYTTGEVVDMQIRKCTDLLNTWMYTLDLHRDDAEIMAIMVLVYADQIVRKTGFSLHMGDVALCFLLATAMEFDERIVVDHSLANRLYIPSGHNNALFRIFECIGYNAFVDTKKLRNFKLHVQSLISNVVSVSSC